MKLRKARKVYPPSLPDYYQGSIVIFVYARWWHARVDPGWLTFADWDKPNFHIGVFREDDVGRAAMVIYEPIETTSHVEPLEPVTDEDVLGRIAFVRFGRVPGWNEHTYAIIDFTSTEKRLVGANYDDTNGIDPDWMRGDAPLSEPYWRGRYREEMAELLAKYQPNGPFASKPLASKNNKDLDE
jgi:hypothetical protein